MFNALVPELDVSNYDRSLDFYTNILGFELEYDRSNPSFALLSYGSAQLMIQEQNTGWASTGPLEAPYGRGINFQITTKNLKLLAAKLSDHNYPIHRDIEETWRRAGNEFVGEIEIHVLDPDGYFLRFSEMIGRKTFGH
ncbi:MAG: VOC family protein [Bacteroidota bacterium]|nr:VOC family protein [Bacteroidota bacterium]MDP4232155.1 VOC family protein [Bacteroidota bacterium]MDP4241137.1 VOC family protein [Bacteroidota bacterium]MDP4286529.1 VOC family protein [Bacteroidota bacterium]